MFSFIRNWWHKRIIRNSQLTEAQWQQAFSQLPLLARLTETEIKQLRRLATVFLYQKSFEAAQGVELTDHMKMLIALQACLPILHLGLEWYNGWVSIIVYPDAFIPQRTSTDANGVVHHHDNVLGGEAWLRGPVILSWQGVADSLPLDGNNLVIHEFVHKLDMRNGVANGFPPLHKDMSSARWAKDFHEAFDDLQHRLNAGESTVIDEYAASDPAEFFAVISEIFFERPQRVNLAYPDIYQHLANFFRQNPL